MYWKQNPKGRFEYMPKPPGMAAKTREMLGKSAHRRRLDPLPPAEKAGELLLKKRMQYKTPYTYERINNIFI
jgi:hypothetical protein